MYSLGNVDIHANNDRVFILICQSGHLHVAKWLYSLDEFENYKEVVLDAFVDAYTREYLDLAKWLYSLDHINANNIDPNNIKIINWIRSMQNNL